jgi:iron complex outermembrane recepter protein
VIAAQARQSSQGQSEIGPSQFDGIRTGTMRIRERRILLATGASWLALSAVALAEEAPALPDVNVTAPSPIVKRKPAVVQRPARVARAGTGTSRGRAPQAQPAPAAPTAPTPQQDVLPIVTDQFATVTVVPNEEIRRQGTAQLGDLLFSKPGITGSTFAPGAASRPIIRGLDVNRVGIVENGNNAGGASDLGEDHFVPVDPLATNQVEVIRGPAAMRYGSTSIGGVVSATNNRIPDALPSCAAAPFQTYGLPAKAPLANVESPPCVAVETRTAVNSVDRGVDGGILIDAGAGNFAVHADAFGRKASDYSIPSYPYLFVPDRPFNGRQPTGVRVSALASLGAAITTFRGPLPWQQRRSPERLRRRRCERFSLLHNVRDQNDALGVGRLTTCMGCLGRYLEGIAFFDRAGRLTLYGKFEGAFDNVSGFDPRMRVSRNGGSLFYCRLDK